MAVSASAKKRPAAAPQPDAKRSNLTARNFRAPLMTQEEVQAVSIQFQDAPRRLKAVLDECGFAIVTGCVDQQELVRLEALFRQDLEHLLAAPFGDAKDLRKPAASTSQVAVQCEGTTKAGKRCTVTSAMSGLMAKYSKPLQNGARFCSRHGPAVDTSARAPGALTPRDGSPLRLSDWPLESLDELGQGERCSQRGLPHGSFAWACRREPSVRSCYEILHGTNDLVTGLDNSFFVPETALAQTTNREWPHVDQNFHFGDQAKEWDCYQSMLYIWPSTSEHASTTVVWPRSHRKIHGEIMNDVKCPKKSHFVMIRSLSQETQERLLPIWREQARRVPVPAGALLMWNSCTVHQGWSGGPRLAHPICWEPRSRRDDAAFERKLRMSILGLPSTHWASLGIPHTMLAGIQMPPLRTITIQGKVASIRPALEIGSCRKGLCAITAWKRFADQCWNLPLEADLRKDLENSLDGQALAAL